MGVETLLTQDALSWVKVLEHFLSVPIVLTIPKFGETVEEIELVEELLLEQLHSKGVYCVYLVLEIDRLMLVVLSLLLSVQIVFISVIICFVISF